MDDEKRVTRKSSPPIKVYCLPEERELIEANAKRAGISVARYLRDVGQGYQIKGVMDYEYVRELVRVNGDCFTNFELQVCAENRQIWCFSFKDG